MGRMRMRTSLATAAPLLIREVFRLETGAPLVLNRRRGSGGLRVRFVEAEFI